MQSIIVSAAIISIISIGSLSGCDALTEGPEDHTIKQAYERSQPGLNEFADSIHRKKSDFTGPYFLQSHGLDYPTYEVCYKIQHAAYYCYDDWSNNSYGYLESDLSDVPYSPGDTHLWLLNQNKPFSIRR